MLAPENGLAVMRVQAALIELGDSVGPGGADGAFGADTGAAVTRFKTSHSLDPTDPVVGTGTATALDDDLFFDPPILDPVFAEFSPLVVDHRVEPDGGTG
jgi:peptidoglycan hydrolase-like protein with peptidoglycan-binding domain